MRYRDQHGLPVIGLMCIPPADEEPAMHFALLAEIARRNGLAQLSMGMSADFETAVQFGATLVRVGTAMTTHAGNVDLIPCGIKTLGSDLVVLL